MAASTSGTIWTDSLPRDAARSCLVGRVWIPEAPAGPRIVALRDGALFDISSAAPTMAALLTAGAPAELARRAPGASLGRFQDWYDDTLRSGADLAHPHLLAPNDLQVVKAAGVTFVVSMLERVIEELTRGDPAAAEAARATVHAAIGSDIEQLRPGSEAAARLKRLLIERGLWSQYLEVGIGPDAEVFTKAPPMASVGTCAHIGLHPASAWNNPEPEIVLAVNQRAQVVGATLGNDVNLRDFEGRSALLLGKAKDNNASCAIGPFIRLFDADYGLDDVRSAQVDLRVEGEDGFVLQCTSSMAHISRDPLDLVAHAMGPHHQYPDGMMLFCGTMFAPTQDRGAPGAGFTHHLGDRVTVGSPLLGTLLNRVDHSDKAPPWTFGIGALMQSLALRGLLDPGEIRGAA